MEVMDVRGKACRVIFFFVVFLATYFFYLSSD